MRKSDLWVFVGIAFVGAVICGGLAWAFFSAFRRTQSVGKRVIIGIFLGIFGLLALGFSACGLVMAGG